MSIHFPSGPSPSNRLQSAVPATVQNVDAFINQIEQGMTAAGTQNTPVFQQLEQLKAGLDAGQLKPTDALQKVLNLLQVLAPPGGPKPSHTVPVQPAPVGSGYPDGSRFTPPVALQPRPVALTPPPLPSRPGAQTAPASDAPTLPASSFMRSLMP